MRVQIENAVENSAAKTLLNLNMTSLKASRNIWIFGKVALKNTRKTAGRDTVE
jgi:hypothetical protein